MELSRSQKLWILFKSFFMAGTFTFTGGLAMVPVIQKDLVEKHQLIDNDQFLEYVALSQSLPGVIAVNCASYIGKHVAGGMGMFVASIGATISAFFIMLAATIAIQFVPKEGPAVGAMNCIHAASGALILAAAFTLGAHNLKTAFAIILMLAAFTSVFILKISTPFVVIGAGLAGYIYQLVIKKKGDKSE
ncbi:MAG: chromate transporter [Oscillospiraceae bacterium]|nr:chromate transporter [Oscillospiraceae bacterium]